MANVCQGVTPPFPPLARRVKTPPATCPISAECNPLPPVARPHSTAAAAAAAAAAAPDATAALAADTGCCVARTDARAPSHSGAGIQNSCVSESLNYVGFVT